jgi:hypothetical protein
MLGGNIHIPFPENLRDPVDADPAPVRFQDLLLAFSPGASRLAFRIVPALVVVLVLESGC